MAHRDAHPARVRRQHGTRARVPVSSMAAATLLNRTLKEDKGVHVMGFSLPPSRTPTRDKTHALGAAMRAALRLPRRFPRARRRGARTRAGMRSRGQVRRGVARENARALVEQARRWRRRSSSPSSASDTKSPSVSRRPHDRTPRSISTRAPRTPSPPSPPSPSTPRAVSAASIDTRSIRVWRPRPRSRCRRQRTRRRENRRRCRVDGSFADDGDGRGGKRRVQRGYVRGRIRDSSSRSGRASSPPRDSDAVASGEGEC